MISLIELQQRMRAVRMVVMDVDGVLTDGRIWLMEGGREMKQFHVHDGTGIKFLQRAGVITAIITGRESSAVNDRAQELGIPIVYQDAKVKTDALDDILRREKLDAREVCYIGDDMTDIPVMRMAGVAVAVSNARPEVKQIAHYITSVAGGCGAVREVAELLLKAQDKWEDVIMARYRQE
jgi:3-deoxy-D-manno-octulosonate 8-phosphate phosphatase (KDO 8-P phosphatase)